MTVTRSPGDEGIPLTHIRLSIYVYSVRTHRNGGPTFLFKTLADPTRLRLLNLLACGETCVCELTGTLRVVQPKGARHPTHLKRVGLLESRPDGKCMHY